MIEPIYHEHGVKLYRGDSRRLVSQLPPASVDAVVTDPPYELGLAGSRWDRSGVAFDAILWRRVLEVLKPGAWLWAFGAPKLFAHLQLALESAGFEVEDCGVWLYGQGFPKGKTRLKPSWEAILLARRPGQRSKLLNIDESILGSGAPKAGQLLDFTHSAHGASPMLRSNGGHTLGPAASRPGRYPPNVFLDQHVADGLDRSQPHTRSARRLYRHDGPETGHAFRLTPRPRAQLMGHDDEGGPSRYFFVAKPGRHERDRSNLHLSVKPLDLIEQLVKIVSFAGETVLDPFSGSGTTALACQRLKRRCLAIELEQRSCEVTIRRLYRHHSKEGPRVLDRQAQPAAPDPRGGLA